MKIGVNTGKGVKLWNRALGIIPGGSQLLSKQSEQFLPGAWPAYYKKAQGCRVWDLNGNMFYDMSYMGIGACILGYADKDVNSAVKNAVDNGNMTTLNCPEEVELARCLCKLHPWARMARFARTGGEAMAIAIRIARAKTGNDLVLFCGYHGWHDWYLSANVADDRALDDHLLPGLKSKGVPRGLGRSAIPFAYNDTDAFLRLAKEHKTRIAAVVMEPIRNHNPGEGFLETIRETTSRLRIPLIFDEITSGWRLANGGAHLKFGVYPDICVFAKAISNGYAMAAIIGKKELLQEARNTFISSTYWTERIGPVAALATIKKIREAAVPAHLTRIGKTVQQEWVKIARSYKVDISVSGIYPLGHFVFNSSNPLVLKTLFTQYMLGKGFLATNSFYASLAHGDKQLQRYFEAVDQAFSFIKKAQAKGNADRFLKGAVCYAGFKRLT